MKAHCPSHKKVLAVLGIIVILCLIWFIVNFQLQLRQTASSKSNSVSIFDDDFEEKVGYMFSPGSVGVFLYDYQLEEKWDFHRPNDLPACKVIWHAYVINSFRYPVVVNCFVEFQDIDGSIIKRLGPISRTVLPSKVFPEDIIGVYWMPDDITRQVALWDSRVYIQVKK